MRQLFHRTRVKSDLSAAALTPMVDLFTILVIAVLRASSPEPPIKALTSDFQLPISRSEIESTKASAIEIGIDGIALDGIRIGSTVYWSKQKALMPELKSALLMIEPPNSNTGTC